jgi:hypothetical protein
LVDVQIAHSLSAVPLICLPPHAVEGDISVQSTQPIEAGKAGRLDTPQRRADRTIYAIRRMFEFDHTVEDCLELVLEAARREFHCHVTVAQPLVFFVDGCEFTWPLAAKNEESHRGVTSGK